MPFCKFCGSEIPLGAKFCRNCGQAVVMPSQPQPEPVVEAPAPQPTPEPVAVPPVVPQPEPVVEAPAPQPAPEPVAVPPVVPQPEPVVEAPAPQPIPEPVEIPPIVNQPQQEFRSPFEGDTRKKSRLPLIIILSVLILAGVGAALWLFVFDKKTDDVELTYTPKTTEQAGDVKAAEETPQKVSEKETVAETENVNVTNGTTSSLSTQDTPKESDFSGWFINGAARKGMPKNVTAITDLSSVSGSWKALFYQDPDNKYDVKAYGFANVNVSGTKDNLKFGIKRHTIRFLSSGEVINEEGESEDIFMGKWQNGKITASGAGSLSITSFWEQNGKQYAIGTFDSPDGIPVKVGMVRP